jgi:hypothetical protein
MDNRYDNPSGINRGASPMRVKTVGDTIDEAIARAVANLSRLQQLRERAVRNNMMHVPQSEVAELAFPEQGPAIY